ncbi:DegT/DnrJ/EryC1/StrS family aminotransferase [Actinoplanes sp. GCM10030250]|uniref:DegT/DnrJ/EryC1/StrS family aminotransferase n=1 Tax=Actinoplanes sp. GCM10030250 TaxID=3273376 RepID=UPI00361B0D0E
MNEVLHYYRGRVALHAILSGLGVKPGDEVVVQAYTCAAVIEPLLRLGVRPVFADIDRDTFGLDPDRVRDAITPRTRAVIVQHTFGIPVPLDHMPPNIPIIEDCAHITAGENDDERSVAAFYSYEWGKPVVAGVGGTAVVHDPGLAAQMRTRYDRLGPPPPRRELLMTAEYAAYRIAAGTGVLWRLRSLYRRLAGLGVVVGSYAADPAVSPEYDWRMSRTVRWRLPARIAAGRGETDRRRRVARAYRTELTRRGIPHTAADLPLRIPVVVADKERALREAAAEGVELGDWFATPVHPLSGAGLAAAGYTEGSCPNAEWAAAHVVTIPVRAGAGVPSIFRHVGFLAGREATRAHV